MKKCSFLFFILIFNLAFSQNEEDKDKNVEESLEKVNDSLIEKPIATTNNYRWRIEVGAGESRGIRPFSEGYFSSNSKKVLGVLDINSVSVGATYTYSKLLGFKLDFAFDRFKNKDDKSNPFEVAQFRTALQGIINLNSILNYQNETSRFKVMFHSGFTLSTMREISSDQDPNVGSNEWNGGVIVGITPMYRIARRAFIYFDFSSLYNFRQHYTWDGEYSKPSNNLSGQMINGSFGISYALGKQLKWEFQDQELKKLKEENEALEKRVGDLETMMNDTDKDGVADYLDSENNSIAGVAVDSRGVMVDSNRNGVPDELERYFEKTYGSPKGGVDGIGKSVTSSDTDFLQRSINEGYISVFFESNSAKPNTQSTDGIHFILTFLKANPDSKVDIIGYSDEIGDDKKNEKLAMTRANAVKRILMKSGIDESRLKAISGGEDASVDADSKEARRMVRRVVFRLK